MHSAKIFRLLSVSKAKKQYKSICPAVGSAGIVLMSAIDARTPFFVGHSLLSLIFALSCISYGSVFFRIGRCVYYKGHTSPAYIFKVFFLLKLFLKCFFVCNVKIFKKMTCFLLYEYSCVYFPKVRLEHILKNIFHELLLYLFFCSFGFVVWKNKKRENLDHLNDHSVLKTYLKYCFFFFVWHTRAIYMVIYSVPISHTRWAHNSLY